MQRYLGHLPAGRPHLLQVFCVVHVGQHLPRRTLRWDELRVRVSALQLAVALQAVRLTCALVKTRSATSCLTTCNRRACVR